MKLGNIEDWGLVLPYSEKGEPSDLKELLLDFYDDTDENEEN